MRQIKFQIWFSGTRLHIWEPSKKMPRCSRVTRGGALTIRYMIHRQWQSSRNFRRNVAPELAKVSRNSGGGPEAYAGAVELALQGLAPFCAEIEANLAAQDPLLEEILSENERYASVSMN